MQKCRKIDLYYIYQGVFTKFSTFAKRSKQQTFKYTKLGFAGHVVQEKTKVKSMNITSNTNYPNNETRKLVEEVVPPQSVAAE